MKLLAIIPVTAVGLAGMICSPAPAMPPPDRTKSGLEVYEEPPPGQLPPASSEGGIDVPAETAEETNPGGRLLPPRKRNIRGNREPRSWSLGMRVGSLGNTGPVGQYVGSGEFAWNVGLNFRDYENKPSLGLTLDRLLMFDEDFARVIFPTLYKWQESRGKILYLAGAGFQMDAQGLYVRLPLGAQYSMLADPVTWSVQATIFAGQVLGTKPGAAFGITPEIAVRYRL